MRRGVIVLGGNGFIGSRICQITVRSAGLPCTSIARGGPPKYYKSWMKDVKWVRGDASKLSEHKEALSQASAVLSQMERICGDVNIAAMKAAKEAGVPSFVYISAHMFPGMELLLPGYVRGKRKAEVALAEIYGKDGVALRPTFIYGVRRVGSIDLPLGIVGAPLAFALNYLKGLRKLPLDVAVAAIRAAVDERVSGVVNVEKILRLSAV